MGELRTDRTGPALPALDEADRRAAFARLTDVELDRAYRLAGVILGNGPDAQDATHDAVVQAWRGFGTLRDASRFQAWFQRILVNTCRDRLRRRRRSPVTELDLAGSGLATGGNALSFVEDRLVLDRAFGRLSPDQAITLVLRYYADLSVDDIATRMGVPAGTVKSRLHAALGALQAALERAEVIDR